MELPPLHRLALCQPCPTGVIVPPDMDPGPNDECFVCFGPLIEQSPNSPYPVVDPVWERTCAANHAAHVWCAYEWAQQTGEFNEVLLCPQGCGRPLARGLENRPVEAREPEPEPGVLERLRRAPGEWWNRDRRAIERLQQELENARALIERLEGDLHVINGLWEDAAIRLEEKNRALEQELADSKRTVKALEETLDARTRLYRYLERENKRNIEKLKTADEVEQKRLRTQEQLYENVLEARKQTFQVGQARDRLSRRVVELEEEMARKEEMSDERAALLLKAVRDLEAEIKRMEESTKTTLNAVRKLEGLDPWPEKLNLEEVRGAS